MYQQWLQVAGLIFDGIGFGLVSLEWYRGYLEMRSSVTLVARNLERSEKIRLRNEIKQAIGSALAEMADHAFEMQQVDQFKKRRVLPFFSGVVAFVVGMVLQLAGTWPGCCAAIGIIPQSLG